MQATKPRYLFTSERLGFRNWYTEDITPMYLDINSDKEVMRYFPYIPNLDQTTAFITRMQQQFDEKHYCYFAVDLLDTQSFIGFIGLSEQTYLPMLSPFVDIGWRLAKEHWGYGYATEGAKSCLVYGFEQLRLSEIYAVAPLINQASIRVMQKIGMQFQQQFAHPMLLEYPHLEKCALYCKTYST